MGHAFRKQTHSDFVHRIQRIEARVRAATPAYLRRDRAGEHVRLYGLFGFAWTWGALKLGSDRNATEAWLLESGLPRAWMDWAVSAIAATLAVSFVVLMGHVARGLMRSRGYYNSGALLVGFSLAIGMMAIPAKTYRQGYDLLGSDTQIVLADAGHSVRNFDWSTVIAVSSQSGAPQSNVQLVLATGPAGPVPLIYD